MLEGAQGKLRGVISSRLVLASGWLALVVASVYRWHSSLGNPAHTVDFEHVYRASGALIHGGTMYTGTGENSFVYLPSAALIFLPFRALALSPTVSLSIVLQLVSFVVACALVVKTFKGPAALVPICATVMVLSEQTLDGEIFGNVDLYLPVLVAATVTMIDQGRSRWAGVFYGLSVAIKPLVAAPALLAIVQRRWGLLVAAITTVLLLCIPGLILTDMSPFFHRIIPFLAGGEPNRITQVQSVAINSVLRHDPAALRTILRVAAVALGLATCVCLWRRPGVPEALRWLEVSAAGQVTLGLANGFTFSHHVTTALLLVPAIAAPAAIVRRPVVFVTLILFAVPRAILPWSIAVQQCVAMGILLGSLLIAAQQWDRAVRPGD